MLRLWAIRVAILATAACGRTGPSPHTVRLGPALTAMLGVADRTRAPWRCSGSRELAADAAFGAWDLRRGTLRHTATASKPLLIGIVADAAGNAPKTLASLARLRAAFERASVDLVLTLGGMGSTQAEIAATVGTLVGGWPIVALPGDLEPMSAHLAAIAELRARGAAVIDGRGVRTIEGQDAMVALLPGVGSVYRTVGGSDGCVWAASDIAEVHRELSRFAGLRIAVSAEAPRAIATPGFAGGRSTPGEGVRSAIANPGEADAIIDGEATGEVALVPQVPIDVVVHGPTGAAPSPDAHGDRSGAKISLSPGSADATTRLPPSGKPAAGVLTLVDRAWEWQAMVDHPSASEPSAK